MTDDDDDDLEPGPVPQELVACCDYDMDDRTRRISPAERRARRRKAHQVIAWAKEYHSEFATKEEMHQKACELFGADDIIIAGILSWLIGKICDFLWNLFHPTKEAEAS